MFNAAPATANASDDCQSDVLGQPGTGLQYYWVGGSGNWSDYANHWATSSNGTTFHNQVPTSIDDVHFDENSFSGAGQTVNIDQTIVYCNNFDWRCATNDPAIGGSPTNTIYIYGSMGLTSAMSFNFGGQIRFLSQLSGEEVITDGENIPGSLFFMGNGGEWNLKDGLSCGAIIHTNGTLNTNGEAISISGNFLGQGSTAVLNLGTSVVSATNFNFNFNDAGQLDADQSSLTVGFNFESIEGASFNNIHFWGLDASLQTYNCSFLGTVEFDLSGFVEDGNNDFNVLIFNGEAGIGGSGNIFVTATFNESMNTVGGHTFGTFNLAPGKTALFSNGTTTILTAFNASGIDCSQRSTLRANGSATLSKAFGTVALSEVILQNLTATGGATFTASNSIDLGNNPGWTIAPPASRNLYWVGGAGNWSDANHWSTNSNGSGGACIPSAFDDVFFDENSGFSPGNTVDLDLAINYCRSMCWAGVTGSAVLDGASNRQLHIFGSLTLSAGMTFSFPGQVRFLATSAGQTILSANRTLPGSVFFTGIGGEWTLQDAFSAGFVTHSQGTLNSANFTISTDNGFAGGGSNAVLNLGASTLNLHGANFGYDSPAQLDADQTNIFITTGMEFDYGHTFNNVTFASYNSSLLGESGTFLGTVQFNDDAYIETEQCTFNTLVVNGLAEILMDGCSTAQATFQENAIFYGSSTFGTLNLAPVKTFTFTNGTTQTLLTALNASGINCAQRTTLSSSGSATFSMASGSVTISDVILQNIAATGGATFTANTSVGLGNNPGWAINSPGPRELYWVDGGGNWSDENHWSLASGGDGGECQPSIADDVYFDENSGFAPGQSVQLDLAIQYCHNMVWTDVTGSPSLSGGNTSLHVHGSLTLSAGMNFNSTAQLRFRSTLAGNTIFLAGKEIPGQTFFDGIGGVWTLDDNFSAKSIAHLHGTLNTANFDIATTQGFGGSGSDAVLNLGTSTLTVNGAAFNYQSAGQLDADQSSIIANTSVQYFGASGFVFNNVALLVNDAALEGESASFLGTVQFGGRAYLDGSDNTFNVFKVAVASGSSYIFNENGSFANASFESATTYFGPNQTFGTLNLFPGKTYILPTSGPTTILPTGLLNAIGNGSFPIEIKSSALGFAAILHKDGLTQCFDFLYLTDINHTGSAVFYAGANSDDVSGNSGWVFTACCAASMEICDGQDNDCDGTTDDGFTPITFTTGLTLPSAPGASDGAINLTTTGAMPLTFAWSTSATTEDVSGLAFGPYQVSISGADGCTANTAISLASPETQPILLFGTAGSDGKKFFSIHSDGTALTAKGTMDYAMSGPPAWNTAEQFYGANTNLGTYNQGVTFQYNAATGATTTLKNLRYDGISYLDPTFPIGEWVESGSSFLTTSTYGGTDLAPGNDGFGTIMSPFGKVYDFENVGTTGGWPISGLIKTNDGKFYVATDNDGGILEYTPPSNFVMKNTSLSAAVNWLAVGRPGKICGKNYSSFFEMDRTTGNIQYLTGPPAASFFGRPFLGDDGQYYFLGKGGNNNKGAIYKVQFLNNTTTTVSIVHHFNGTDGEITSNDYRKLGWLRGSNGQYYALAQAGGQFGLGVLFRFDPAVGFVKIKDFDNTIAPNPGFLAEGACLPQTEICDGLDNDCDNQVDEGLAVNTYYYDADGDGYGDPNQTTQACAPPPNHVDNAGDNNDQNYFMRLGAPELCDGMDNDGDGQIDEGLTPLSPSILAPSNVCSGTNLAVSASGGQYFQWSNGSQTASFSATLSAATTFSLTVTDDDDGCGFASKTISVFNPAPETCNYTDDDCDGLTDEGLSSAPELCNTLDDDCDGLTDEGFANTPETMNGLDDDCDGAVDETGCPAQSFNVHDQAQLESVADFLAANSCNEINGYLNVTTSSNALNFNVLSNLKGVTNFLAITNNTGLASLAGLENLESIGNGFSLNNNGNAAFAAASLPGLKRVTGNLNVKENTNLVSINFPNLSAATGLVVSGNPVLTAISFPGNLTNQAMSRFEVTNNAALATLNAPVAATRFLDNVWIYGNPNLATFTGFDNLAKTDFDLLFDNSKIVALPGASFQKLHTVGRAMSVRFHSLLTSLNNFGQLKTIGSHFNLSENPVLANVSGSFGNVQSVNGFITLSNNPLVPNFDFDNSTSATGLVFNGNSAVTTLHWPGNWTNTELFPFRVTANAALTSLQAPHAVTTMHDNLWVENNPNLAAFSGFEALAHTDYDVIFDHTKLTALPAGSFQNLHDVGRNFQFRGHTLLTALPNFANLQAVATSFRLQDNPVLASVAGSFGNLQSVGGTMFVRINPVLTAFDCPNLQTVGGLEFFQNSAVQSLTWPANLTNTAMTTFKISENTALATLAAPPNVVSLSDNLHIFANPNLANFSGFEALQNLDYDLIFNNSKVPSFTNSFGQLAHIGRLFQMQFNSELLNLNTFSTLASVANNFTLTNNPKLDYCCGIYNLLNTPAAIGGTTNITSNKSGCLSKPEILTNCPDNDGDGYQAGYGDCDDANASVNPGETELCNNNIDDNCDGQIDENKHPDYDALMAFFYATDGPNWAHQTGWGTCQDPTNGWFGVTCFPNGRVRGLELASNGLSGSLPPQIGNLTTLEWLLLNNNSITGQVPVGIGNLGDLRFLYLNSNLFSGNVPAQVGNLTNLEILYLDHNQFSGTIPPELGNLAAVNYLTLNNNNFSGSIPSALADLNSITILLLNNNQLSGPIPPQLGYLPNINWLIMHDNQLSGCFPASLANLCGKSVYLHNNAGLPGGGSIVAWSDFCTNGNGVDADGDQFCKGSYGDCDDSNPAVHVGLPEIVCNTLDDNCNGVADELLYSEAPGLRTANDGLANDKMGWSIALAGDLALAGAPDDRVGTVTKQGSAYLFARNQGGAANWGQAKQLVAQGGAASDFFGHAVALSGDYAFAGADFDNVGANTDQGSGYVFKKDHPTAGTWGQLKQLFANDGEAYEYFGNAMAASGQRLIVGALSEKNGSALQIGAAYLFEKDAGGPDTWNQVKKLVAGDRAANHKFGTSVGLSGDWAIAGAPGHTNSRGAAYVFQKDQNGTGNWGEVKKLLAGDPANGDLFGASVAVSGDVVLVGAYGKSAQRGYAYIFQKNHGGTNNWGQVVRIGASDGASGAKFGWSVKIEGDYAYVGAPGAGMGGAVYVFQKNLGGASAWGQLSKIVPGDAAAGDQFGYALGIAPDADASGDLVVGATLNDAPATDQGSAYVFTGTDCNDPHRPGSGSGATNNDPTQDRRDGTPNAPAIRCQPNPFGEAVTLEFLNVKIEGGSIRVLDARGRLVRESALFPGQKTWQWQAENAAPGLFFIQILNAEGKVLAAAKAVKV